MKKILFILAGLMIMFLAACGASTNPDYTTDEFESALNDGGNLVGKTVAITVDKLEPKSAFGYDIQTGEHLNFVSSKNPDVKAGDEIVVKVTSIESVIGSYIIEYKMQ